MFQIGKYNIQQNNVGQWLIHFKDDKFNHTVIAMDLETWLMHYVQKEYWEPIADCANGFRSAFNMCDEDYLKTKYKEVLPYLEIRELSDQEKRENKHTVRMILSWYVAAYNRAFGTHLHHTYVYPLVSDMVLADAESVIGLAAEHTFKGLVVSK